MVAVGTGLKTDGVQDFAETSGSMHWQSIESAANAIGLIDIRLDGDDDDEFDDKDNDDDLDDDDTGDDEFEDGDDEF
jgi:hypothetical protein